MLGPKTASGETVLLNVSGYDKIGEDVINSEKVEQTSYHNPETFLATHTKR
jgi:hypothetical protein